jgi:hypothetical protein
MTQKLVVFKTKCEGKEYIGIAPGEIIDDVRRDFSDVCESPKTIARDIDIVEIVSPKGKMKKQKRSDGNDILDIEIRKD